jgi:hypothetical protein
MSNEHFANIAKNFQRTPEDKYVVWKAEIPGPSDTRVAPTYWSSEEQLKATDPYVPLHNYANRRTTRLELSEREFMRLLNVI